MSNVNASPEKREEIMKATLAQINEKYKGMNLGRYGEKGIDLGIKKISTGSLAADYVLGGGWGRFSCILGYPSAGKTTLALSAIAKIQREKPDANILFVDAEYALDVDYAASLGVDIDKLYILQPDSSPQGYGAMEMFIQSGVADFVVLDSIAAMFPEENVTKEIGEEVKIASMARLTTQAIQRLNRLSAQFDVPVLFINQYKEAVNVKGVPGGSGTVMGNSTMFAPGGPTKDFYFQQLAEIKRAGQIKEKNENGEEEVVANVIQIRTLKNKIFRPYLKGQFTIRFGQGLDRVQEAVGLGIPQGFIRQAGAFYQILDADGKEVLDKPINGRSNLVKFLEDPANKKIFAALEANIKNKLNSLNDNKLVAIDKGDTSDENSEE